MKIEQMVQELFRALNVPPEEGRKKEEVVVSMVLALLNLYPHGYPSDAFGLGEASCLYCGNHREGNTFQSIFSETPRGIGRKVMRVLNDYRLDQKQFLIDFERARRDCVHPVEIYKWILKQDLKVHSTLGGFP